MKKMIQSLVSRGLLLALVLGLVGGLNAQGFDGNGALEAFYVRPHHDHHVRNKVLLIMAVAAVSITAGTVIAHERGGRGFTLPTTTFTPQAPFAPPAPGVLATPSVPDLSGPTLLSCSASGPCVSSNHH